MNILTDILYFAFTLVFAILACIGVVFLGYFMLLCAMIGCCVKFTYVCVACAYGFVMNKQEN